MKTLTNTARIVVLAAFVLAVQISFAQQITEPQEQQKYQINIVKNDNGKQEVIDKTFDSKADLEAYIKENKIDASELNDLPALPAKKVRKAMQNKNDDPASMKKIVISESTAGSTDGHTSLNISYQNYSAEERAQMIQTIINEKGSDPKVIVEIRKQNDIKGEQMEDKWNNEPKQPAYSINEVNGSESNLSDVKVFPNPSNGQFHIEFSIEKAVNVHLRLADLNGKEIYTENVNNYSGKFEKDIKATTLSSGNYILEIQAGNQKRTTQVVMQ